MNGDVPHKFVTFNKNKPYKERFYEYYNYKNPIDLTMIE